MKEKVRKENQNVNQTPIPEYHSTGGDVVSDLVVKYAKQIQSTNTPILSYELFDNVIWMSPHLKKPKFYSTKYS